MINITFKKIVLKIPNSLIKYVLSLICIHLIARTFTAVYCNFAVNCWRNILNQCKLVPTLLQTEGFFAHLPK